MASRNSCLEFMGGWLAAKEVASRGLTTRWTFLFMARPNLHNVLYARIPTVLIVCLLVFLVTVAIAPMSKLFVAIAIAVGMLDSLISMEELTGGNRLSWLSIPVILIGDFFAYAVSFGAISTTQSWALILQFVAIVFFTESLVIVLFRSRLEAFNAQRKTR